MAFRNYRNILIGHEDKALDNTDLPAPADTIHQLTRFRNFKSGHRPRNLGQQSPVKRYRIPERKIQLHR